MSILEPGERNTILVDLPFIFEEYSGVRSKAARSEENLFYFYSVDRLRVLESLADVGLTRHCEVCSS